MHTAEQSGAGHGAGGNGIKERRVAESKGTGTDWPRRVVIVVMAEVIRWHLFVHMYISAPTYVCSHPKWRHLREMTGLEVFVYLPIWVSK